MNNSTSSHYSGETKTMDHPGNLPDPSAERDAVIDELVEALRYVLRVREVECLHPHRTGHDEFCARCQANAAIERAEDLA